jgi:hypothetical protein
VAKLRAKSADLRAYGASGPAQACAQIASDLEANFRAWWLEELPVTLAAAECGYSADRLREMCRENELPHTGDGIKSHYRLSRRDLPRKARRPGPDLSPIEAKLLRTPTQKRLRPAS